MAPPTVTYNNSIAKYTNYERNDTGATGIAIGISKTEVAIAKAILTRDIDVFNNSSPTGPVGTYTKTLNYDTTIGSGTSTNVMFNHQQNDLGTVFAITAEHTYDSNNKLTNAGAHTSYTSNGGTIGGSSNNTQTTVAISNDSASYYDSELRINTNNTEKDFYQFGSTGGIGPTGTSRFKTTFGYEGNFNSQKLVNSRHSTIGVSGTTGLVDPIQIAEDTAWNSTYALYTEDGVGVTGAISGTTGSGRLYSTGLTPTGTIGGIPYGPISTLGNNAGSYYSGSTGFIGIDPIYTTGVTAANNNQVFFGTVKAVYSSDGNAFNVGGTVTNTFGPDGSTLAFVPEHPGSDISSSLSFDEIKYIMDGVTGGATGSSRLYSGYSYTITGVEGGGYYFDGTNPLHLPNGITIDDSSLLRNSYYMSACNIEGNSFVNANHSFEIINGSMTGITDNFYGTTGFTGYNNTLFTTSLPSDINESLQNNQYATDFTVDTYFTVPNLGPTGMAGLTPTGTYYRASVSGNTGAFNTYTDFEVLYHSSEASSYGITGIGVLGSTGTNEYYNSYTVKTILPASGVTGGDFSTSNSNYITTSNGLAFVMQDGYAGSNVKDDYTFIVNDTSLFSLFSGDSLLIQLTNNQQLAQENTFYVPGATSGVTGTSFTARGSNFTLKELDNTNNVVDLRIEMNAKATVSSIAGTQPALTNNWTFERTSGSTLITDISKPSIFGSAIYPITADVTKDITLNFAVGTNGSSNNYDGLDYYVDVNWTWNNNASNGTYRVPKQSITLDSLSTSVVTDSVTGYTSNNNNPNTATQNLLSQYVLKKYTETRTFMPKFTLPLGPYSNLGVKGGTVKMVSTYYGLEKSDNSSVKLPDGYLYYYKLSDNSFPIATREFATDLFPVANTSTTSFSSACLYGFTAVIKKNIGSIASPNWVTYGLAKDFDPAFNNILTFTNVGNISGTIVASADITVSGTNVILDQPTYYVELSTANTSISYSLNAYRYGSLARTNISTWSNNLHNVYSKTRPTEIVSEQSVIASAGLYADVSFTSPAGGSMSLQPNVTITIKNGSNTTIATITTSNDNATSDFNIWYTPLPLFAVTHEYGDSTVVSNTSVVKAATPTTLKVANGISLKFLPETPSFAQRTFTLLGDRIQASAYTGYAGAYSTLSEVTNINGLDIGDTTCRNITLSKYRGNSVNTYGVIASATLTYERFTWERIPTQVYMKLVTGTTTTYTYTSQPLDLYSGSSINISDLSGATGIINSSTKGNLGLIFNGAISRYGTYMQNPFGQGTVLTPTSYPITVSFGSYDWVISNPTNTTNSGPAYVKNSSGNTLTSSYIIVPFLGIPVVATRVKVYSDETLTFALGGASLRLFYSPTYITSNPSTLTDFGGVFQTIDNSTLEANRVFIKVPTNTTINSIYSIKKNPTAADAHIGYFILAPPVYSITAVSTSDVSTLPYNNNTVTRVTRYFSLNNAISGIFTFNNTGINNMYITANSNTENYLQKKLNPNNNSIGIYIPSNKITIDLHAGNPTDNGTPLNKITTVYDGYIHNLTGVSSYTDTTITPNITTYYSATYNTANNKHSLKFSQDVSLFTGVSSSLIYGTLGNNIYNIELNDLYPFTNFINSGASSSTTQHFDLLTGDSTKLRLYGHTYGYNGSGDLVANIVRYTSATGFDFSSAASQFLYKNLQFVATSKEIATVVVKANNAGNNTLGATPFNFITDTYNAGINLSSLTWSMDGTFVNPTTLNFAMSSLTKAGEGILASFLGVSNASPYRSLVCYFPPRVDLRSADGSPLYLVNSFGSVFNVKTHTSILELVTSSVNSSDNVAKEYINYNALNGNAV